MASRKEEEPEPFKVVDRRLFTSDGERRPDAPPEPPPDNRPDSGKDSRKEASAPPPQREAQKEPRPGAPGDGPRSATASPADPATASAAGPARAANATIPGSPPPSGVAAPPGTVQFEHLIMSLVSSAMYQLGMAAPPGQVAPPPDLHAAQETIDIIGLLQQKTKGNLTPEEDELLNGSLQELRLAFVELSRRAGRMR